MGAFTLEHGRNAYIVDFALYGGAVLALADFLLLQTPRAHWLQAAALTLAGLAGWTLIEYLLHRFVLHGLQPFLAWHAAHHKRPVALIYTPTALSGLLFFTLIFLPVLLLGNLQQACAFTLGVLAGYLVYAVTHHATHHWRAKSTWSRRRKHWHALHHRSRRSGYYGVSSGFWDHVFGTGPRSGR